MEIRDRAHRALLRAVSANELREACGVGKVMIAVGTTRGPKLGAVEEVIAQVGEQLDPAAEFEVIGVGVASGVSSMPITREETMAGARGRAESLAELARANGEPWKYFVGLEGGLDVMRENGRRLVFLQNWAYVRNEIGRGAYGQSGAVLLPESLAEEVVDRGVELAEAIDAFAGGHGIRDAQGAWGILTRNWITRQEAFRVALINAFAPFLNAQAYK